MAPLTESTVGGYRCPMDEPRKAELDAVLDVELSRYADALHRLGDEGESQPPLTIVLKADLALGRTLRCFQGHVWDHYEPGYEATITMLVPELRVAFDCPECHTLHIEEVPAE